MATVTMAPKLVLFILNSSSPSFAFQIEDTLQLRLILTLKKLMHHTKTMFSVQMISRLQHLETF
jgi:hypothetical protein